MAERTVVIASAVGLHARPAALFVRAAAAAQAVVTIGRPGDEQVDARSILRVMGMSVKQGETLVLRVEGPDAEGTLESLGDMLEQDLDA